MRGDRALNEGYAHMATFSTMLRRTRFWLWAGPLLAWLAFCYWYSNTAGPLSAEEIERFSEQARQNGRSAPQIANLRRFMEQDDGDQFLMVNLLLLTGSGTAAESRPTGVGGALVQTAANAPSDAEAEPPAGPSAPSGASALDSESPAALMDRYMAHMLPAMLRRASHPALAGPTVFQAMDLAGIEGAEDWGSVGVVRYRSRRDIMQIALDPVFAGKHEFKIAALEKTIAVPMAPALHLSDLRLLLLLVVLALSGLADALWRRRPSS